MAKFGDRSGGTSRPVVSVAGLNGCSPQLKAATPHEIQVLNNSQNTLPGNIPLRHAARLWDVFQARCILPPSHAAPSGRWQPERNSRRLRPQP